MAATDSDDAGFLSRWARRKAAAREGVVLPEPLASAAVPPALAPAPAALAPAPATEATAPADDGPPALPAPPPPTLDDVALLTRESDFTRFVARSVQPEVRNAALKKLFTDPHFNVMDGLDTYIDDYGQPDPIPSHWLKKMAQAQALGLFQEDPDDQKPIATAPEPTAEPPPSDAERHAHPDLQLQPHDDAGCAGAAPGAEPDAGRPD